MKSRDVVIRCVGAVRVPDLASRPRSFDATLEWYGRGVPVPGDAHDANAGAGGDGSRSVDGAGRLFVREGQGAPGRAASLAAGVSSPSGVCPVRSAPAGLVR